MLLRLGFVRQLSDDPQISCKLDRSNPARPRLKHCPTVLHGADQDGVGLQPGRLASLLIGKENPTIFCIFLCSWRESRVHRNQIVQVFCSLGQMTLHMGSELYSMETDPLAQITYANKISIQTFCPYLSKIIPAFVASPDSLPYMPITVWRMSLLNFSHLTVNLCSLVWFPNPGKITVTVLLIYAPYEFFSTLHSRGKKSHPFQHLLIMPVLQIQ